VKAIVVSEFGLPEVMKYIDIEIPVILPHQVLIKVEKSSVNYADVKSRYGNKNNGSFPFVPGLDTAGVIAEIGALVTSFQVGQRVIAFPINGSYAEYVVADTTLTFALPDHVPFDVAAACPTVSILSYKLLVDIAKMEQGETILIHSAAGGVGSTAIQLAKIFGASNIIGTVGNESKASVVLEAGANHVICYEKEDFAAKVNELTDGKGVNIVFDSLGGTITESSLSCLADYGRLVQFGNSSGKVGTFKTSDLHSSCRSVLGYSLGTTRKSKPETLQHAAKEVLQLISEDKLKIHIGHRFPLSEAVSAHKCIESRQSTGKIVLDIG